MPSDRDCIPHDVNKTPEKQLSIVYDALNSAITGIIITGIDGYIEYANPAFLRLFEYGDESDVMGKMTAELFADSDIKTFSDLENRIDSADGLAAEFLVQRKNGRTFYVEVAVSAVTGRDNEVVGNMASFVDITRRKLVEEENRRLSLEIMASQEKERQRVANDVHDTIGQTLHAAKLNFLAYKKDPVKFEKRFNVGLSLLDRISQDLREVCEDLYPVILSDYGLESAATTVLRDYLALKNIESVFNISIKSKLEPDMEIQLYRIIKEAFVNIVRHSNARKVELAIKEKNSTVTIKIKDNGCGFDPEDISLTSSGMGLKSMQGRVKSLGGIFIIDSKPGRGTVVKIELERDNGFNKNFSC